MAKKLFVVNWIAQVAVGTSYVVAEDEHEARNKANDKKAFSYGDYSSDSVRANLEACERLPKVVEITSKREIEVVKDACPDETKDLD